MTSSTIEISNNLEEVKAMDINNVISKYVDSI